MSAGSSDRTFFGDWWLKKYGDTPAQLRFMLEVARYANKAGEVSVSVATIARAMKTDERHVWRYRKKAVEDGALVEIGRAGRSVQYRLNYSNPGKCGQGNDSQGTDGPLAMNGANPGNEQHEPLATAVVANGTITVLNNGIDRNVLFSENEKPSEKPSVADIPGDVKNELASALKRYRSEAEIDHEIKFLPRQVGGIQNIGRLIGWLNSDLSRANNPVAVAISKAKAEEDPPVANGAYSRLKTVRFDVCGNCGREDTGSYMGVSGFWCSECQAMHARRTAAAFRAEACITRGKPATTVNTGAQICHLST